MDPFSVIIILSIGNIVAWLAALYVKDAARGLIGHVVVATTGAFIAGNLALWLFPDLYAFGMMTGAVLGAVFLLYFVRHKTWRLKATVRPNYGKPDSSTPNWSEKFVREQYTSIIVTIVLVVAVFSLLGWCKALEIRDQKIGLFGIDTPERHQFCHLDGRPWMCGEFVVLDHYGPVSGHRHSRPRFMEPMT